MPRSEHDDQLVNSVEATHLCREADRHRGRADRTDDFSVEELYGASITNIVRVGGRWWARAGIEYATEISVCPWCGTRLQV